MSDVKLNLGSGATKLDGYLSVDRTTGGEVYPLQYDDESVDEIYASHILEHFSHTETISVLKNWTQKLRPGGRIRIAVPDFKWIADEYAKGKPINTMGYVMGGHVDDNDRHGALFDSEQLTEQMMNVGLERISHWKAEIQDCAALDVSLNLQGFKPTKLEGEEQYKDTVAVLSAPRFGPVLHMRCAFHAFYPLGIRYRVCQGAYWHEIMSIEMRKAVEGGAQYVLTLDYDTVFHRDDIRELSRLMRACPEVDAICSVQSKRGSDFALFGLLDSKGKPKGHAYAVDFQRRLTRISTGHFGLTLFRASALRRLSKPWMHGTPDENGCWEGDHIDPDISFWLKWKDEGFTSYMANQVVIGHLEEIVKWPGHDFKPVYQSHQGYSDNGMPAEVAR